MSYADVNGVSLYYDEHGSGQPLILLHGGLPAAVIPFLDAQSLEPPPPFGM